MCSVTAVALVYLRPGSVKVQTDTRTVPSDSASSGQALHIGGFLVYSGFQMCPVVGPAGQPMARSTAAFQMSLPAFLISH